MKRWAYKSSGFTIVELLIVVIVIAILATIVVVSYNGVTSRAKESAAASSVETATKKMLVYAAQNSDQYPTSLAAAGISDNANTIYEYSYDNDAHTYCITATFQGVPYHVSNSNTSPSSGFCSGHFGGVIADGVPIQAITALNCPTAKIRAVDARDNHTYWVQKLADGKCWMLTNLAYAGGGTNTYHDVFPTGDGTNGTLSGPDNSGSNIFTAAKYYTPADANPSTEPANPSADTTGGGAGAGRQYGYLYNWCAAMGAANYTTSACANASTPQPDVSKSICPAGWRLPSTSPTNDFAALNTAINSGSTAVSSGLRLNGLFQYSGIWASASFSGQGGNAIYRSSTQSSAPFATVMSFTASNVTVSSSTYDKGAGAPIRCIAN